MGNLIQDLRYGLRMLARNPGFTAVAVAILALGIGANTAIFSLIDAIMLRSLPVKDPQQLVSLRWLANRPPHYAGYSSFGGCASVRGVASGCSFSFPTFERVRADNHTLSGTLACAGPAQLHVMTSGEATLTGAETPYGRRSCEPDSHGAAHHAGNGQQGSSDRREDANRTDRPIAF